MRFSGLAKCIRQHLVIHVYSDIFAPLQHEKQTKTTQKMDWCFTTNIYPACISRAFHPACISRAFHMHFSSPEECIWHWFPIMFSLGFCWLMTYSILLMSFLCKKVAVAIEKHVKNNVRHLAGVPKQTQNEEEHAQVHFSKWAKCIRAACSFHSHNRIELRVLRRKDKLRTEEANAQLRFSRVPKCTQMFSPLKKYRKREHGVANVESKTKRIFQAWQNACGQHLDIHVNPSFGLGKGCSDPWRLQREA